VFGNGDVDAVYDAFRVFISITVMLGKQRTCCASASTAADKTFK
jgi:hypothetical protein